MRRAIVGALAALAASAACANAAVYVANSSQNTVSIFSVATGGTLTALGLPVTTASGNPAPGQVAVSPSGQYAYVTNFGTNSVSAFFVGATGGLTAVGTPVAAGSGPVAIALSPDGTRAYVADYGAGAGTVYAFSVGAGGALTQIGSPVQSGTSNSSAPYALVVSPDGTHLYVNNNNQHSISTFAIAADGSISQVGTPVAAAISNTNGMAITPDGRHLYVDEGGGAGDVEPFTIGSDGRPAADGGPVQTGAAPAYVAVAPNGQHLYVSNQAGGTVSTFAIAADGTLTAVGSPAPAGNHPDGIAVSADGRFLYMANNSDGSVSQYSLGSNGAPTSLGAAVLSGTGAGSGADGVATAPDVGPTAAYTVGVSATADTRTFSAAGSAPGSAPIATYSWSFGDGTTATGATVSHTFAAAGAYSVTLTVTDSDGCATSGPWTGVAVCAADPGARFTQAVDISAPVVCACTNISPTIAITKRTASKLSGTITLRLRESVVAELKAVATFTETLHRRVGHRIVTTHRKVTFGTASGTTYLIIKPRASVRALLRSHHTLKVTVVISVDGASVTTTLTVKLR